MLRTTLTGVVTAAALISSVIIAVAQAPVEINFGVLSTEASVNQKKNWEPFLAAVSKGTGFKVNGFYATDYAGVIEAMRFNKIQVAWYGNKSAMEAVDRAGGEVFAQIVSRDGSVGYYSHIIVHRDGPYAKLADILHCDKSMDFGIGDPNSTSGYLVPTSYIFAANNIDPKSCFKRNASHQANAMAVANKQVGAATNNSEDLQRVAATAPAAREQIRIIWTSPLIPLDPLVWRKDLDPAVKTRLYTCRNRRRDQGGAGDTGEPRLVAVSSLVRRPAPEHPQARGEQGPAPDPCRRQALGRREDKAGRVSHSATRKARRAREKGRGRRLPAPRRRLHRGGKGGPAGRS
jgi:phosphonate ABC transporter binding protein